MEACRRQHRTNNNKTALEIPPRPPLISPPFFLCLSSPLCILVNFFLAHSLYCCPSSQDQHWKESDDLLQLQETMRAHLSCAMCWGLLPRHHEMGHIPTAPHRLPLSEHKPWRRGIKVEESVGGGGARARGRTEFSFFVSSCPWVGCRISGFSTRRMHPTNSHLGSTFFFISPPHLQAGAGPEVGLSREALLRSEIRLGKYTASKEKDERGDNTGFG